MDTLMQSAVTNAIRILTAWNGNPELYAALVEEVTQELARGTGEKVEPPEITPEQQGGIDETLDALGLGRDEK